VGHRAAGAASALDRGGAQGPRAAAGKWSDAVQGSSVDGWKRALVRACAIVVFLFAVFMALAAAGLS
jgi:hypothetical protein